VTIDSKKRILAALLMAGLAVSGCKSAEKGDVAPPPVRVIKAQDMSLIEIDSKDAEKFKTVTADKFESAGELNATGAVFPDVSREVPVISLANGRVVDIKVRLDDAIKKGQLMFRVQSPDINTAFDAYLKAVNDEQLADKGYIRAKDLLAHGAVSQAMFEQAEAAENNAKADLAAADEQLKLYGVDKQHPSPVVNVYAPTSGVVVTQNITNGAAAGVGLAGSATAFTIADLSQVWVVCDIYENDISKLQLGQEAKISVISYPDRPLKGRISDIGPILDPSLRTAKVRIEVANPGFLKLGMFATATFTSRTKEAHAVLPADALLHLHDRDWVFVPAGDHKFKRTEIRAGQMLSGNRQLILSGVEPGQQVMSNALLLESGGNQ
jgi:membrane fusion protein, heavy metal efflux system